MHYVESAGDNLVLAAHFTFPIYMSFSASRKRIARAAECWRDWPNDSFSQYGVSKRVCPLRRYQDLPHQVDAEKWLGCVLNAEFAGVVCVSR